jgi:hypothetical protein
VAKPAAAESPPEQRSGINWGAMAPGIAFVLILGAAFGFYLTQNAKAERGREQLRAQIASLGLPEGYPLQDIPVYPGLKITEQKRDTAMSSDNKPMDLWEIKATSPDDKQQIFDFVKEKMMARKMSQTQYISLPTGYGVHYGDEQYFIEYEIEKFAKDAETRVVMRVYRIK